VLAVSALRRLGVGTVIARAETRRKAEVLRAIGATRVLEIEAESGRRLAGDLVSPIAADLLALADSYRVVPWVAEGALVGKSLVDAQLRQRFALNVLGIRPAGAAKGARLELPRPEHVIQKGDTLLLVGEAEHVTRFFRTEGEG
jgi:trk system potassium uptake protein TrkA